MKILQVCHKPPLPAVDGGCIAINNITQMLLAQGHDVKVLAISTPKHKVEIRNLPQDYVAKTHFETVFVNTTVRRFAALKSLLLGRSYHVDRYVSREMNHKLKTLLQKEDFDIIQLESLFVAPYIPVIRQFSKAKIILRTHNIEHRIWDRVVRNESSLPRKFVLKSLARNLEKFELSVFGKIDGYMTISDVDYSFFNGKFPSVSGVVIPFGVNVDDYEPDEEYIPSDTPELFHLGSLDWLPNREGVEWFLEEVWPLIFENYPSLTFTVAGRAIPQAMRELPLENVIIAGEVPDSREFMLSKDIMIVPLLSGSGIRVKIIEGMALGKTIITTSIGAEGLAVEHGKNIFIADTPEEFVECVGKCVHTPDICKIIGENAASFVALHHNSDIIVNDLIKFYGSILTQKAK
ncbi:MAG: glycosyltransferase [Bacteroidales bacterium]|nr:glycosyltransferase [Bacteroidales bacterium]MBQ7489614.1 glycosyltransferase [Bacteroidales bacterium]